MQVKGMCRTIAAKALVALLAVALVFTMMPLNRGFQAHAEDTGLTTQTPALVVTGQGVIGNEGHYSAENVSNEVSYTLDELKAFSEDDGQVTKLAYSAKKSQDPYAKNYYLVNGVTIEGLLGKAESEITDDVKVIATDNHASQFLQTETYKNNGKAKTVGLNNARYFYDFTTEEKGDQVPAVIGWADVNTGLTDGSAPTALPTGEPQDLGFLRLYCGQLDAEGGGVGDMNQPLWNGKDAETYVNKVQEGAAITETVLTVGSKQYTRADILMMDFAERTYTYQSSKGEQVDAVRGVPFSVLLKGEDEDATVSFETAYGDDMSAATKTVKELVDGNYMLGYMANGRGIYKTAKSDTSKYGFLTLYGDGYKPSEMINKITVKSGSGIDFGNSEYKHVNNGGITGQSGPYDIDSITGATLTIEGPGVKTSVPLSVRDLETRSTGCVRDVYADTRSGSKTTRTYEGVDLYYLLHNMNSGTNGIVLTDKAYQVKIKNRNRNTIATLTLDEVETMHNAGKPALVAYGTAGADGTNARPFVFDGATGADADLGNEDGCLKFVYDLDKYGDQDGNYKKFGNMAYIYVEEEEAPGFKHTEEGSPYNVTDNTEAIISFTGDTLGREVNYTVKEIEDMVKYNADGTVDESNGYGYRGNYSLTNTTYWYVNEYEGVKLWSMLLHSGLDPALASDDETKINYITSDNYAGTDKFTIKQTADDNAFGFYEKNALDNNDGTYEPNENIRQNNDPATGDKLGVGYPVLLAYGVNSYPYVISSKLDGYLSGLSNDGGPLRVISGKTSYGHNNGSSQAQKFSGVVVGTNNYHYATHKYHSDQVYKDLADKKLTVNINTVKNGETKTTTKTYTIGELEDINYDGNLTPTKLKEAKVKAKYQIGSNADIYEGVNLSYFLKDVVELTGSEGTVTFKDASGSNEVTIPLSDVLTWDKGYCSKSGVNNLVPVLAYGKNGMPLVNKTEEDGSDGYVSTVSLGDGTQFANTLTVKNKNGPLQMIFPGSKDGTTVEAKNLNNVASIEINLSSDKYAHVESPYDTYENSELTISGDGTKLTEAKTFTVAELEGKQTLAGTYDYSIRKSSGSTSTARYRGIRLYDFLKSTNVGLKSNADKVIITTSDSTTKEFSMADIIKTDYINSKDATVTDLPVILAYGSAATTNTDKKDGKPLVKNKEGEGSEGYDAAYGNNGGPLKLVMGQADAETANSGMCLSDVVSIEVTASEITNWNHSSSSTFESYLNNKVTFEAVNSDNEVIFTKELTVQEIEAMDTLITKATLHLENDNEWEGLDLWGLIQSVMSSVSGIDNPTVVNVISNDGFKYNVLEQGLDALKNGVKEGNDYLPILLAYGCDGNPLAQFGKNDPAGPGYDSTLGNGNGPLRVVIHNANGKSAGNITKIQVKVGNADPVVETADFTVASNTLDKDKGYSVNDLKSLVATEKEYTVKGETEKVRGVLLSNLMASLGIEDENATFRIDAGGYAGEGTYTDISLKDAVDQDYLVAYEEYVGGEWVPINDTNKTPNSKVRIYRKYLENNPEADQTKWFNKCQFITGITVSVPEKTIFDVYEGTSQTGDLPMSGVRCTRFDKDGNLWVATYGGGIACKEKGQDTFKVYNLASEPALLGTTVSSLCPDDNGGVWFTQNTSHKNVSTCYGVGYLKDGEVTYYRASDDPQTVPSDYCSEINIDKSGNVWFGCIGGLTKYDPAADTWTTISEGLPASKIKDGIPLEQTGYIENIEFDNDGGIWCGFYPDCEGGNDGLHPYVAGIAYIKDGQVKHSYQFTSAKEGDWYRLQDVWIRDIAIDKKGGIWCVASSIYGGMQNIGGKVYYISSTDAEPVEYSGFDLFGEDAFSENSELRMVTVDPDGGLWFSTSKDGIFRVDDPTITGGKLTLTDKYSSATGSWPAGYDNIYSLDFHGDTIYAGSSKGLATHKFDFESGDEPSTEPFGDATEETAQLTITGDALARSGYYTIKGIKNGEGITKVATSFHTLNSSETEADIAVEGVTLENLVQIAGLAKDAEIASVDIYSSDNRKTTYTAAQALNADIQGNKAMFIWTEADAKVNKVVRGQMSTGDINKSAWAKDVVKIVFNKKEDSGAVKEVVDAINALPAADKITVDDADAIVAAREAYDALSDAEKADVTNLNKLEAAEAALDNAVKEGFVAKAEQTIDEIDFSEYGAGNSISLWVAVSRLESKIKNAETAAEAAELFEQLEAVIADTPTEAEEMQEAMNDYPIEIAAEQGETSIDLSWNRIPKAESYEVLRSDTPDGEFTKVKIATVEEFADGDVEVEKTYFYKVVPRVKVNGEFVYGNESDVFAAKLDLKKPVLTATGGKKKATLKWGEVYGAEGYVIYRSTKKGSGFKAVKTIKDGSKVKFVNKKLKGKKYYYFKMRAYTTVGGEKVYSKYSTVKRIKTKK